MSMLKEVKPRNARTARILKAKEPQLIEQPKQTLLLHGPKCPLPLRAILKTFHSLTKPHSILFHKKNENIHPFENTESIEFLASKNECGVVVYGSSNKKRPNCITVARLYDAKILDMCELLLLTTQEEMERDGTAEQNMSSIRLDISVGMKPMILFSGSIWADETASVFKTIKSLFLDIFKGEETDKVDVEGLQYLLMIAAEEPAITDVAGESTSNSNGSNSALPTIHVRWYKIRTLRSGQKVPRIELDEIGPKFDFRVGRVREAEEGIMKEAMKQGKRPQDMERTKKNIGMDAIGDKIGRVHLGRQDLGGLQTRKMKGLKRRAGVEDDDEGDASMMELDNISEEDTSKKQRTG